MTAAERDCLRQRLKVTERLARGARWERLYRRPLPYLSATLFHRLLYPLWPGGWRRLATTFFGWPMALRLPAGTDIFLTGGKSHDSEIRLCRFLLHRLQTGDTFVDVGAHYGFYSLLAAHLVGAAGRVLALEASPANYALLVDNLQQAPQATALPAAAAERDAEVSFFEFPPLYSEYNSLDVEQFETAPWRRKNRPRRVVVESRRLDRLLAERQLAPQLIKVDVEGAEDRVVQGLTAHLSAAAPLMVMEYLAPEKPNAAHRAAARRLRSLGYRPHRIDADGQLHPCLNIEAYLQEQGLDSDNIVFAK